MKNEKSEWRKSRFEMANGQNVVRLSKPIPTGRIFGLSELMFGQFNRVRKLIARTDGHSVPLKGFEMIIIVVVIAERNDESSEESLFTLNCLLTNYTGRVFSI